MTKRIFLELGVPTFTLVAFFLVQLYLSEIMLTTLVIVGGVASLYVWHNKREIALFGIGLLSGTFVEVVLRMMGTQQHWTNASFFGVPYWLPIAWGLGFVIITRVGYYVRRLR